MAQRQCYNPTGLPVNGVPCFPEDDESPCCEEGWAYGDDGLCRATSDASLDVTQFTIASPSCTDCTWQSTSCSYQCDHPWSSGWIQVCADGGFSCVTIYDNNTCASGKGEVIEVSEFHTDLTTIPTGSAQSSFAAYPNSCPLPTIPVTKTTTTIVTRTRTTSITPTVTKTATPAPVVEERHTLSKAAIGGISVASIIAGLAVPLLIWQTVRLHKLQTGRARFSTAGAPAQAEAYHL